MKIQGLSLEEYLLEITKPTSAVLWIESHGDDFKPHLCSTVLGDGMQIIYFGNTDQRPYYWLVRIDSKSDVSSDDFSTDDIWELIYDECGHFFYDDDDYDEETDCYPMVAADSGGSLWGMIANFKTGEYDFDSSIKINK
jgi:hypothetical protein